MRYILDIYPGDVWSVIQWPIYTCAVFVFIGSLTDAPEIAFSFLAVQLAIFIFGVIHSIQYHIRNGA